MTRQIEMLMNRNLRNEQIYKGLDVAEVVGNFVKRSTKSLQGPVPDLLNRDSRRYFPNEYKEYKIHHLNNIRKSEMQTQKRQRRASTTCNSFRNLSVI